MEFWHFKSGTLENVHTSKPSSWHDSQNWGMLLAFMNIVITHLRWPQTRAAQIVAMGVACCHGHCMCLYAEFEDKEKWSERSILLIFHLTCATWVTETLHCTTCLATYFCLLWWHVAVLGRNQTLLRCVFWSHYCVQSAVTQSFRYGWGSYALVNSWILDMFTHCIWAPLFNGSFAFTALRTQYCNQKICNGIMFDFYLGLPHVWDSCTYIIFTHGVDLCPNF